MIEKLHSHFAAYTRINCWKETVERKISLYKLALRERERQRKFPLNYKKSTCGGILSLLEKGFKVFTQ